MSINVYYIMEEELRKLLKLFRYLLICLLSVLVLVGLFMLVVRLSY
ncbi:hypothetical protein [Dipodfec virus UA06Rod_12]|uniref:Uncharacterized protein n=1 Tax=Dipodfec virus UA06Rod_12 TaxID=2929316 RepID=A0A976N202_9VIRU|nr:hypothetical protein [Dipodfec virus UA06Rod_12]